MNFKAILGLFVFVTVAFGLVALANQPAQATRSHKVDICHANNGNGTGGFNSQNVDDDAVDGNWHWLFGWVSSNSDHSGHQNDRDIIPPFYDNGDPGYWNSRNWDAVGKATFYNDCNTPEVATASVSVDPATCDLGQKLKYGAISNATFSGTPNNTVGPAAYAVTATAKNYALFAGNATTKQFNGVLTGPIGYQSENPNAPCYVKPPVKTATATVTTEPATCDLGEKLVYGAITNASFSGTANGTYGPTAYAVTATADANAEFAGGSLTEQFNGNLAGPIGYQSENSEGDCYEEPSKEADITASVKCATVREQMMIELTLTNSGEADGTVMVNGEEVEVEAGDSVVLHFEPNTQITVVDGEETILDETLECTPGQGGETPETPETPEVPTTPTPMELPKTSGSSTTLVVAGAASFAAIILVAGAALKSRYAL